MKGILVDFWTDTLDNLDELSKFEDVPRNELIRRGAESVLILYGIPKSEVGEVLLEDLKVNDRILSSEPISRSNLVGALSRTVALSSVLSAIYVVNDGKEQANIIRIYFRTLQEHLLAVSDPDYAIKKEDYETIKQDVISFSNVVAKLERATTVPKDSKQVPEKKKSYSSNFEQREKKSETVQARSRSRRF